MVGPSAGTGRSHHLETNSGGQMVYEPPSSSLGFRPSAPFLRFTSSSGPHSLPRTAHSKSYSHPPSSSHFHASSHPHKSTSYHHGNRKRLRRSNSVSDVTRGNFTGRNFDPSIEQQKRQQFTENRKSFVIKRRSLPKKPSGIQFGQIPQIRIDAACAGGGVTNVPVGIYDTASSTRHATQFHSSRQHNTQNQQALFLPGTTLLSSTGQSGYHQHQQPQLRVPTIVVDESTQHQQQMLNGRHFATTSKKIVVDDASTDVLEIPGHGRCFVYIARYSYDPFTQSPNENPESELFLSAGDYLLVWGRMDEDGYLDGQLVLEGRRGLVPSNYVERLYGEDLIEFYQQVVLGRSSDSSHVHHPNLSSVQPTTSSIGFQHFDDESQRLVYEELMNRRVAEDLSYLELEDVVELDDLQVPSPTNLTLERQLNKSILISWNHPTDCPQTNIDSYQVFVNGLLRCTVKANERTRALIEGVDANRPHRISVRAVTPNRRVSRDAACTLVIGRNAPLAPSCVRATNITSTSAVISWLPSNSNYSHVVSVNNVEVRTVKPGVYRHIITVLSPNTLYRVTVRSKNIRAPLCDEKNIKQMDRLSAYTEFRTLPKGLPDPPIDVQVEAGPQDNTLLVTWHPVSSATSNGAIVTGYAVFADGRKVLEIDSPSGDHALLDLNRFQGLIPKQVTVRTKSHDSLSSDSIAISIPAQVIGKATRRSATNKLMGNSFMRRGFQQSSSLDAEDSFSDHDLISFNRNVPADRYFGPQMHTSPDRPHTARGHYAQQQQQQPPTRFRAPQQPMHQQQILMMDEFQQGAIRRRGGRQPNTGGIGRMGPMRGPAEQRHRLFVALFDYDPPSMSPNPDACDEELPFREGQMIKIFGDKDADGFYWGEAGSRRGYVPCNMVSEVHGDDDRVAQELLEGGAGDAGMGMAMSSSGRERRAMGRDRWGDIYANMPMRKMVSLYDYDPQELSPNVDSEVELSFRTGDVIYVFGDMDDDGFYMGELNGMRGLVPSNFLTEAPPTEFDRPAGGGSGRGRHLGPPELRRQPPQPQMQPAGPSVRGPPQPKGGGLREIMRVDSRRKDASFPTNQIVQEEMRNHFDAAAVAPRGGRFGGTLSRGPPPPPPQSQTDSGPTSQGPRRSLRGIPAVVPQFSPLSDQHSQQPLPSSQQQQESFLGVQHQSSGLLGGLGQPLKLPNVFSSSGSGESSNFMQKFSELTHVGGGVGGGTSGGESIFKTGKELIFKKFGLGE